VLAYRSTHRFHWNTTSAYEALADRAKDRMRVLAEAYARLGTGPTEPERWIAFAARKRERS
jgi:hypothetical protein